MKKIFSFLLIFIMATLVLYFSLKDDYKVVIDTMINIDKKWLLLSFLLILSYWILKSMVTTNLAKNFSKEYNLKKGFRMVVETNFFHAITPFSSGGQPYEIYSLHKNKLKFTDATNVSIESFIVYQIVLVALGIIAIYYNYVLDLFPSNPILKNLVTLGFVINLLVVVFLFIITFTTKLSKFILNLFINILFKIKLIKSKEEKKKKIDKHIYDFNNGAKILFKDKGNLFVLMVIQFLSLISLYLIPYALIKGVGLDINPIYAIVTSAYVMLIGSFVPIPGGTGGLEYGFVAFFGNFIIGAKINAIMLLWRFITYYFGMIVGSIVLNFRKKENK